MAKEKPRYYVTTTRVEYYDNDEMAIEIEKSAQQIERRNLDNDCTVVSIVRKNFAEKTETEIYKKEC